ncbi:hypothetical protein GGR50DRAFT_698945 [Xylaria sp. CBS 124048]|nr:hypothetical protein GGR50DRAFT_698945 [Xylaria sp. CBS 124048]
MEALKYNGNISQYICEVLDLNEAVEWSGISFQTLISKALSQKITKMIYSRQGAIPTTDHAFIEAICQTPEENHVPVPNHSQELSGPAFLENSENIYGFPQRKLWTENLKALLRNEKLKVKVAGNVHTQLITPVREDNEDAQPAPTKKARVDAIGMLDEDDTMQEAQPLEYFKEPEDSGSDF